MPLLARFGKFWQLVAQICVFTLIERSSDGDTATVVTSISEVWEGSRLDRLVQLLAAPTTSIVTITITEAGYHLDAEGTLDRADDAVAHDLVELSSSDPAPRTPLARLALGLASRRAAGAGSLAVVPCDNMPLNGPLVARALDAYARVIDPELSEWIAENIAFVSTSVDRITPRMTQSDIATAERLTGWSDLAPVVAEPFSDWVLCGDFPAGRPAWERAGVRFVDDIEPFERRKLWLLNGAHSVLAYAGLVRGHRTVAEAIADPECRSSVEALWAAALRHLPSHLDAQSYCDELLVRFANYRIEHELGQVALESVSKLRYRIVPVALAERAAARSASECAAAVAAWIVAVQRGLDPSAPRDDVTDALHSGDPVAALVGVLSPELAADPGFVGEVAVAWECAALMRS